VGDKLTAELASSLCCRECS